MAEFNLIPQSIECESAEIISRKTVISSLMRDPKIGNCFKYSCSRNASAEILKELNPKKYKCKNTSNLNLSDKLKSEKLYVLVAGATKLKDELKNQTHRHKAQKYISKSFTFAEISKPFHSIINAIENRNKSLK